MDIRAYLERHGSANIVDLSNHFRVAPDAMRGMLEHWIRKGSVTRQDFAPSCSGCGTGSCGGCGVAASFEIYQARKATAP
ncbi:FeoC-like transcriptional regulator [Aliiruegeria haliotis]|nr:FeoC-like transcriptional regulator [Aliiruegeria haliotis]